MGAGQALSAAGGAGRFAGALACSTGTQQAQAGAEAWAGGTRAAGARAAGERATGTWALGAHGRSSRHAGPWARERRHDLAGLRHGRGASCDTATAAATRRQCAQCAWPCTAWAKDGRAGWVNWAKLVHCAPGSVLTRFLDPVLTQHCS